MRLSWRMDCGFDSLSFGYRFTSTHVFYYVPPESSPSASTAMVRVTCTSQAGRGSQVDHTRATLPHSFACKYDLIILI